MTGRLLMLGCGALAREIALAIPLIAARYDAELTVIIAGRDADRARWIAQLVKARSHAGGVLLNVISHELDWNSVDQLAALIAAVAPTVVLNTASRQSAWSLGKADAWSRLVREGGYGVTTALQAALLPTLGRALNEAAIDAVIVNACYPDVVNAAGPRMGLNIRCGIGNIALVAEQLRQHLAAPADRELKVLAGHWDVTELSRPAQARRGYPLVWRNEHSVEPQHLFGVPALSADATLNAFGAGASAALLYAFATNRSWIGHVPGPLGEPGGYPVRLEAGKLLYDLPANLTLEEARSWNVERCERDGAVIDRGARLRFSANAEEMIRAVAPELAGGFDFKDVESAASAFLELRDALEKHG